MTSSGPFVHGSDKAGSDHPVVGQGEHRYECHHNWGEVPSSIRWFETHNVAIDKSGLVYVTHRGAAEKPKRPEDAQDTVVVFDPQGKFVRSFGKEYHGGGHGIDIREEDGREFLYLCCMFPVNLVVKTDLKGEVVWIKQAPAEAHVYDRPNTPFSPTNVAFASDGGFYVGDGYGSHYIHQYDKDARWVRTWGGLGSEPGKMKTPHGLWLDDRPGREPSLVVADRANARLQYFTLDGKHLGFVNEVSFPAHFDIRGEVLLVPDLHARLTLLDRDNKVLAHLGHDPEWTRQVLDGFKIRTQPDRWPAGKFIHPHDACFDRDGNIFVAEWVATGRVTFLRRVG
ncbi:MAG: peptidase [Isosphaeraceae bacterium]